MKIFLQDNKTGAYFQGRNAWVSQMDEAHVFDTTLKALQTSMSLRGLDCTMVLKFDQSRYDLHFPCATPPVATAPAGPDAPRLSA